MEVGIYSYILDKSVVARSLNLQDLKLALGYIKPIFNLSLTFNS